MTSGTDAALLALAGAIIGSLASSVVAVLTLRMTQRAESQRRVAERSWQIETEVRSARRDAYTRFLERQNAIIMAAGEVRLRASRKPRFTEMPDVMRPTYEALQNAWAESLLLAGHAVRAYLTETQEYLDGLVRTSWEGTVLDPRDRLFEDLLDAMHDEIVGSVCDERRPEPR